MQSIQTASAVQPIQRAASFIRTGFVTLNPAQMNVVLRECVYDRQRSIDETHISVLAEAMRRGKWTAYDKLDFARVEGQLVLVNGYHRAHAQVSAGVDIDWVIAVHDCATWADVQALYTRYDTNVRKRSEQAILSGFGFTDRFNVTNQMATALYKAAPIIANGLVASGRSIKGGAAVATRLMDDRLEVAARYVPEARDYDALLIPAPRTVKMRMLQSGGVTAVVLVTLAHQHTRATDFWGGLAANDGLRRGDARATLLRDIMDRNSKGKAQSLISACAVAWNAFWDDRDLHFVRITTGRQVRLYGTPYTIMM